MAKTQWYLFNDFHITPLKEVYTVSDKLLIVWLLACDGCCWFVLQQEVGVFPTEWFTPCILVYAQKGFADHFDTKSTVSTMCKHNE